MAARGLVAEYTQMVVRFGPPERDAARPPLSNQPNSETKIVRVARGAVVDVDLDSGAGAAEQVGERARNGVLIHAAWEADAATYRTKRRGLG